MIPLIQGKQNDKGIISYREELLQRHMNREYLSEEEVQFLTATSELLNRHMNKEYVQQLLDKIDHDILNNIELAIAENIIRKYTRVIEFAKQKRRDFLKLKALKSFKIISENEYYFRIGGDQKKVNKENLMKNRIIDKLLSGYSPEEIRLHVKRRDHLMYSFAKSLADKFAADQSLQIVVPSPRANEFFSRQIETKKSLSKVLFSLKDGQRVTTETSQRIYHPSSKLILNLGNISSENWRSFSKQEIKRLKMQK